MPSAARVRWARLRTAAVSIVAVLILSTLLYLLTGGTLLLPKTLIYMYISDATGLDRGSPVRVGGITVGSVKEVGLSQDKGLARVVRVTIELPIQNLASIPVDSYAELSTESLIGDKFVDISSGTRPERIQPGGELPFKEQVDMLKTLDMQQLEARFQQVDAMLTGIENGTSRVGQFVHGDKMYSDVLRRVGELERGLRNSRNATSGVGQLLYSDATLQKIRGPLVALDRSLAQLQSGQGSMGQLLRDPAQYEKLRADLQGLRNTVAELGSKGFFQSDQVYTDLNRTVTSLIQMVDQFNAGPMFGTTATYDNLTGAARELEKTLRDFRNDPQKYLRLKVF
jgi:phospholipid/cholesterol/gamma-HCH transport system substrate-binding protein